MNKLNEYRVGGVVRCICGEVNNVIDTHITLCTCGIKLELRENNRVGSGLWNSYAVVPDDYDLLFVYDRPKTIEIWEYDFDE